MPALHAQQEKQWDQQSCMMLDIMNIMLSQLVYPEELKQRDARQFDLIIR